MYCKVIALCVILWMGVVNAHEMTPTYPKLTSSYMAGVLKVSMEMFNKREDVEWYEIGVFDKDRHPIPFVSSYKVMNIKYLAHVKFDVFVREQDANRVVYICSRSKLKSEDVKDTLIASVICSKVKQ